jgi:hypothetical protein
MSSYISQRRFWATDFGTYATVGFNNMEQSDNSEGNVVNIFYFYRRV